MSGAHAERAHARLSASGSKRWLSCTPSAALEDNFPDTTSEFAREGTAAHELSELYLQLHIEQITKAAFNRRLGKFKKENEFYTQEMDDFVNSYVDFVIERINEAQALSSDAITLLEQRLDFSEWVPDGFGTGDVVIISDGIMEIIDLKYGKGVPVSAEENTQMRLYALGALNQFGMLYDVEKIVMTIVQPRLDSISSDEMDAEALFDWAEDYVKPKAEMAMNGEGEFVAGDHCRFCKAKAVCRERAEENLKMAKYDFQEPKLLTIEEIAEILVKAEELQKWAKDVSEYALDQAENHHVKFPGWKLVEGRSNRKYTDEEAIREKLAKNYEPDAFLKTSLFTLTNLEKSIGKKQVENLIGEFIIKPSGKPTLVAESDKRPEINSTASAVADFS